MKKHAGKAVAAVVAGMAAVAGAAAIAVSVWMKREDAAAVSVIGGADGPTSIFVAGKLDGTILLLPGALLLLAGIAVAALLYAGRKR